MSPRIALVHTVTGLAAPLKAMIAELIPEADVFNIVDESLLQNTIRAGKLSPTTYRRLSGYLASAEEAGADLVMVTCSSVGPAVDAARKQVNIPVFRIDEPMARKAVEIGQVIGAAATLRTTLEPTADLIRSVAQEAGKPVEVIDYLCEGAFEALMAGDAAAHDEMVARGLKDLMGRADVIVLAQASMARIVDTLPEAERKVPVLSSPRLAVEHLAAYLR